jgi:hypothetical protein
VDENNSCLTAARPKSSSGDGAFVGRIFAGECHAAKLLLYADVRRGEKKRASKPMRASL